MASPKYTFEDFLEAVEEPNKAFITQIHDKMLQSGYDTKIELKKSGYLLSYFHKKSKKTILNYVFRKKGMIIRIYGDNVNQYVDFINSLPPNMKKDIEKAKVCKRLIKPDECNSRCPKGYTFNLDGMEHKKCRSNSFMFLVNQENNEYIKDFIGNELRERSSITT